MPQLQTVDLTPTPRSEPTHLESLLSGFSGQLNKNREEARETDALRKIYDKYREDGYILEDAITSLRTDPDMPPTTRVNAIGELINAKKVNASLVKSAGKNVNSMEKTESNKKILRHLEDSRGLKPGELDPYIDDPKMAEQISRPPKEATTAQANKPIDDDQLKRIQHVRKDPEFASASASKKYQMLTDKGVSRANAEAESKIFAEEEKNKPGAKYSELREKAIGEYVNNSIASGEEAENMKFSLDEARKAVTSGDITGPGITAVAKENPYMQLMLGLTPNEALLSAANKKLLEGTKSIFGSKPTEREIFLLLKTMLPSIGKTEEANLAGLNFIERVNDLEIMQSDIVSELTDGGTKFVPDLEKQVSDEMRPNFKKLKDDLRTAVDAVEEINEEKGNKQNQTMNGKIRVKAPDGTNWEMTQEQIDAARKQGVNFEPIK